MTAFAVEFHWTPDQVYDLRWHHLVRLTLAVDDIRRQRADEARQVEQQMTQAGDPAGGWVPFRT